MAVEILCAVPGCGKKRHSKGYCSAHATRLKRYGDPVAPLLRMPQSGACSVEGCEQPARKRGWCTGHYSQVRRTGQQPQPFKHKWSARTPCIICGKASAPGRRRFCSEACQMLESRSRRRGVPTVPRETVCVLCGDSIDLFGKGRARRKRRVDTRMCGSCSRSRKNRHKYAVKVLRNRDGGACGICGQTVDFDVPKLDPDSPSVDHIIPRAHGGSDEPSNLQLAHLRCNQKKHARMPSQAVV